MPLNGCKINKKNNVILHYEIQLNNLYFTLFTLNSRKFDNYVNRYVKQLPDLI